MYFSGKNNVGDLVYASLQYEIYLIEGLRANLLIGNDIMSPEAMVIDLGKMTALIGACRVTINVDAKQRGQFLAKRLLTSQESVIPPLSEAMIPLVKVQLPDDRDFLFHLTLQENLTLYSHIMDYETSKILVRNASDRPLCVPHQHKLDHLLDMAYENCFLINSQSAYDVASVPPSSHSFSDLSTGPILPLADVSMETVLNNGIKVFGDASAVK